MICQIKRDPNTNEIVEVLDPFGRPSKVFDKYVEHFSDTINDPIILKEEAAKLYLNFNNSESMVQNLVNSDDFPMLEETINKFLELNNKESLLILNKLWINITDDYQQSLDNLKYNFINLGYDIIDVQDLSQLYLNLYGPPDTFIDDYFVNEFFYKLASVTKDKNLRSFINDNLPLYNNFKELVIKNLDNLYKLPENINYNRRNYRNTEGKTTTFIINKEYNLVINDLDKNLIRSKLLPLLQYIRSSDFSVSKDGFKEKIYPILNGLIDNDLIKPVTDLLLSSNKTNVYLGMLQLLNSNIYSEALEEFITKFDINDFYGEIDVLIKLIDPYYEALPFSLQPQAAPEESRIKIDKAKENIRAILGDAVEVSTDIETVMDNMKVSGVPFGLFFNNLIYLNEKAAEQGTEYHEAFHAVFRMFLNDNEIDLYINEARKEMNLSEKQLNDKIDKLRDSVSNYESLSKQELEQLVYEEYLADRYQAFTKTNKPSTSNLSIVNLFNRLMNAFLKLIGVRGKVDALFHDINNQRFKNKTITPNRFVRQMRQIPAFQLIILDNQGLDKNGALSIVYAKEQETDKIISDIAALVYHEIRKDQSDVKPDIVTVFNKVMEERFNFYNPDSEENSEIINIIAEKKGDAAADKKYNELIKIQEIFNVNNEENKHNIDVILDGLKDKYKLFNFNPFDDDYFDENKADNREMLDITNVEIGGFDMIPNQLREFMSLVTYEVEDEYTGRKIFKSVDGSVVYNGLIKSLASKDFTDVMDEFEKFVEYGNDMSRAVYQALKEITKHNSDEYDNEHQLVNLFRITFDKEKLSYLQTLIDSDTRQSIVINALNEDVDQVQIKDWYANWDNNKLSDILNDPKQRALYDRYFKALEDLIFEDSLILIKNANGNSVEYKKIFKDVITKFNEGFKVQKKDTELNIPSFEKLTGMTLSEGLIIFSILDNFYNENVDLFKVLIPKKDQNFYTSFKELLVKSQDENKIAEGLTKNSLDQIKKIMFKSDEQVTDLKNYYEFKVQKLREQGRDSSKFQINPNEYRNIYIPFPDREYLDENNKTETKVEDVLGFIKKIANANALFDETVTESSFQDANQNQRYSHVLKSYQSVATRRLRDKAKRDKLAAKYPGTVKNNYLLSGTQAMTESIFKDFKFENTGDLRQTPLKPRDEKGKIIEGFSRSTTKEGKGVTSKTIDFKSLNLLQLTLFKERKVKKIKNEAGLVTEVESSYFIPKIFETKSTDEAIQLPVNNVRNNDKFFDLENGGMTDSAVDTIFDLLLSEISLIDRVENELNEGIESLLDFMSRQNNSEERLNLQLELAKLENKEYNTENLSTEEAFDVINQQGEDIKRKQEIKNILSEGYTGPILYEDFHIQTDGKGNLKRNKDGSLKGVGRGFDLWNFKELMKYSNNLKSYVKARKELANMMLLEKTKDLTPDELNKKSKLEATIKRNSPTQIEKEIKDAIREMFTKDLNNYHNRLSSYKIISKSTDGKIDNLLVPFDENKYKNVEDFIGDFYFNDFINSLSYNLLIDKDPRIRKNETDAVKRNAGSLAFGPNAGQGEFTVAYRDEQEQEYDIVTGKKEKINRDDGQAHMSTDRFIFILKRNGKLGDSIKPIIDKIRFGEKLTWDELKKLDSLNATFNSVKGVYFDGEIYHKLSYAILIRELTSWLPKENQAKANELKSKIKELEASVGFRKNNSDVKDKVKRLWDEYETLWEPRDNHKVLHNMRVNMQLNSIDEVLPKSASKLITPVVATDVNGYHDFSYNTSKRKNEFWRLQVETPSGKTKITFMSQLLQIIDNEQDKSRLAAIRGEVYEISDVVKKYRQALTDRVRNSVEHAISVLGYFDGDGKFQRDMVNFQKKIKQVLLNSGSDEVLLDFFREFSVDGKSSKYNFNIPAIAEKFEQQFLAHFSKNVLQQVVPGRKVSLISDYGNEVIVDQNDNVITRLSIDENPEKYYEKNKDTGKWSLKKEYKTRRLRWSESDQLQGFRIGDKLITQDDVSSDLFNLIINELNDKKVTDEVFDNNMLVFLSRNNELLREYIRLKTSLLIDSRTKKPIKEKYKVRVNKVISGLQTGIDTLGLLLAKEIGGLEIGGTTTSDFGNEKGKGANKKLAEELGVVAISDELQNRYDAENPKSKKGSSYYNARTEQNVINSDVTIYFSEGAKDSAGLISTRKFAEKHGKPFFLYGKDFNTDEELRELLSKVPHGTINIAGNREGGEGTNTEKLSDEFKSDVEYILTNIFSPYTELEETDPNVTVNYAKLRSLLSTVKQASVSEVMMPAWSKEIFNLKSNDIIDYKTLEEFKAISDKLTEEDYRRHKTNKKAIDSILQMFATRIPTEDKRSMISFKVVDFLPLALGDVAVLPLETVLFSGEDFDIDSKYTLLKDFYTTTDDKGNTNFHVYGEYTIKELRSMYNPNNLPEISDDEILNMHLFEEYIKHIAKDNSNVRFDLEEAKAILIGEQYKGVNVFYENDKLVKELRTELETIRNEADEIGKEIKLLKQEDEKLRNEYIGFKSDLETVNLLNVNIDFELNSLPDNESTRFISDANNIFKRFSKEEHDELSKLSKQEWELSSSKEYTDYLEEQQPNNDDFSKYIDILNSLSNTDKINDTTRQGLESYVDMLNLTEKGEKIAEQALYQLSQIKDKAAKLKEKYPVVKELEKVTSEINLILSEKIKNAINNKGVNVKLTNSKEHYKLKTKIYREAKNTIREFRNSVIEGRGYDSAVNISRNKNQKWNQLQSVRDARNELIEEVKPKNQRIAELFKLLSEQKKLVSTYNLQALLIAMRMNKLPSSLEEFLNHPHYKRLNNSAINNEIVDMVSLLYLNSGMDKVRYESTDLEPFHGDGKENSTNIGLSKTMLLLTGRNIDDFLYNSAEGKMQAKEANKLGAQLIGPVAITNIVKAVLARSKTNMTKSAIIFDGKTYDNLSSYESEDIGFNIVLTDEGEYQINLEVDAEGKPKIFKDKRIMAEISLLLAAMTDNAKHGDAFKLNLSLNTLGTYTYLMSLGIGTNRSMLLANQPALYEFNKLNSSKTSAVMSSDDIRNAENLNEIKTIQKKYEEIRAALENEILNAIKNDKSLDTVNYNNSKMSFTDFVKLQTQSLKNEDLDDISLNSLELFNSIKTFKDSGIDYLNETTTGFIDKAKSIKNLNELKELYSAIVTQSHVIKAFDKLQKQSKTFSSINALLRLNQGLPSSFYELQNLWDMIDTFQIDTEALLKGSSYYTKLSKSSNAIYDIQDVLEENQDMKQMLIHFLKINEISKEFVISQTDFFDGVFNKIVENLRLGIKDRANSLKQIKKDLSSFLTLNAYRNSFVRRGERVPFGPELLYTNLVDPNLPNEMLSKTLSQQLEDLLNDSDPNVSDAIKNNIFIKTIRSEVNKIASDDINLFSNNPYGISINLDLITADTRKKIDPDLRKRIVNGFRELMSSTDGKIRQFADNLFYYTIVKDGMQFKNSSFIKYLPAEIYQDYSDILEKVNTALRNNVWESTDEIEGLQDLVGMSKKEIENSFISLFARDIENRSLLKSVTDAQLSNISTNIKIELDSEIDIFTSSEEEIYAGFDHDNISVDVSHLFDYSKARIALYESEDNEMPLLTTIYKSGLLDQIDNKNLYEIFEKFLDSQEQKSIRKLIGYSNKNEFNNILSKEKNISNTEVAKKVKSELTSVINPIVKNTPFNGVYDKNGLVIGLEFPLFFVMEKQPPRPDFDNMTEEEQIAYEKRKIEYETFVLVSFDGMPSDVKDKVTLDELEEKNKYKYKGRKAVYVKVDNIHTSIYNYLYTPQEYKHLMLRLVEMQKKVIAPLSQLLNKDGVKADIQLDSLTEIGEVFAESKDSFAYNLEMTENPQLPGGSLLKVVEDFKKDGDTTNSFSKSEEKLLSKRMFGNERYKLINDSTLSVNLLSDSDKNHLKNENVLIKPVTNKDVLSKLDLKIGETALITINNVVYKVTSKGVTTPYDIVSQLGLDKKNIKSELSPFISEYNNDMNNWLGYDRTSDEYLPFKGKSTQIYQIQPYYEKEVSKVLENRNRPNYGVKEVITVFSDNLSNLKLHGLQIVDEVNTEGFIPKVAKLYMEKSPNIVVVFDNGSSETQASINIVVNNNVEEVADKVTNAQKGLFVIDTKGNMDEQIQDLKNFFIVNNIPNVYNKVMIIKSKNDNSDYTSYIKSALTNELQSVGLSQNLSVYFTVTKITNDLRKLGYLVKPDDILSKGTIDVLPSLLTKSEDGKKLYTYILQNADKIKAESDMYIRSRTVLSDKTESDLQNIVKKTRITKTLPHNMKHIEPDRNGLSMSPMRDDLVSQNIKTTYDAIISFLRTQTSRKFADISDMSVGEIVKITSKGRAPIYVKITNISDKSVNELLSEDYAKLGLKYDPNNLKIKDLQKSEYARNWSKKQGWDISYMMLNMDSIKDKYDVDFEYIPNIDQYARDTNQTITDNKFGFVINDEFGYNKNKALNANGFIGYTDVKSIKSKVNDYLRSASNQGIATNDNIIADSSSQIFVAVPANNTMSEDVKKKIINKAIEILNANGTLLMNNLVRANNEYNISGEGVILKELYERFNNLTATNVVNYTEYSLSNFEKDLETDGQVNKDCK